MPQFMGPTGDFGVPGVAASIPGVRNFANGVATSFIYPYQLVGRTIDASGTVLSNCIVQIFRTADDSYVSQTTSDASGNYAIPASNQFTHYLVAYLPGSPDRAGTTVNTLTGS